MKAGGNFGADRGAGPLALRPPILLLALTLGTVFLLLFRLDYPAFWIDELFTASYIRNDFDYLVSLDRPDERHPPGHYVLLKAWAGVFGDGRTALRGLSVLAAALCLPLFYALVRQRLDARTALLATLFLAVFPWFVHHGREARMYAPLFFFLLLASLLFVRFWTRRTDAGRGERIALMAGFAMSLAACFYMHYTAAVYYMCFGLAAVAIALRTRDATGFAWVASGITFAFLIALPQIFHAARFVAPTAEEWIPATDVWVFYGTMKSAYTGDIALWGQRLLYPVYPVGFWLLWRRDPDFFIFAVSFLVLGPLILAAIGTVRPTLIVRTVVPMTLLAPLLVALVARRLPLPAGIVLSLGVVGFSMATSLARSYPTEREILFIERAAPFLADIDPATERVYFIEHLYRQLVFAGLAPPDFAAIMLNRSGSGPGFVPISFRNVENQSAEIAERLGTCAASEGCGRTIVLLETSPRFETEAGARWHAFARDAGPSEIRTLEDHTVYVYD